MTDPFLDEAKLKDEDNILFCSFLLINFAQSNLDLWF